MSDDSLMDDFMAEASQLLEEAEESLLGIEKNEDIEENFNKVYRAFHSLKGAAGMMGLTDVQSHMHHLEDQFDRLRGKEEEIPSKIDFFLRGIDSGRSIMEGESVEFDYTELDGDSSADPAVKASTEAEAPAVETSTKDTTPSSNEGGARNEELKSLIEKATALLLYQFSDLDDFLKKEGRDSIRTTLKVEIKQILDEKQRLIG